MASVELPTVAPTTATQAGPRQTVEVITVVMRRVQMAKRGMRQIMPVALLAAVMFAVVSRLTVIIMTRFVPQEPPA